MFKKISKHENYWGVVEDVEDPLKAGRIKVRVNTIFDEIPVEVIPWSESIQDTIEHDLPAIGSTVIVTFPNEVAYMPVWHRKRSTYNGKVSDGDYASATILVEKSLLDFNINGNIRACWTETEGFLIEFEKDDILSEFIIRPDSSILVKNGKTSQAIHINDTNISIGREDVSQQPAVVGNDNMTALQKLNDEIKTLSEIMETHLKLIGTVCSSIAPLKPLNPLFKAYASDVKTQIATIHSTNNNFFPETKSTVVTVDKTLP